MNLLCLVYKLVGLCINHRRKTKWTHKVERDSLITNTFFRWEALAIASHVVRLTHVFL